MIRINLNYASTPNLTQIGFLQIIIYIITVNNLIISGFKIVSN